MDSSRSRSGRVLPRCVRNGPPEKSAEEILRLEKSFVLDGIAVSTFSDDSGHAAPKLSTAIPPYNAQKDRHSKQYFASKEVRKTLRKTGQLDRNGGESMSGRQVDRFYERGRMGSYINSRNSHGAGHSTDVVGGHAHFLQNVNPINGFNGPFGFRRNTPWLRQRPSVFEGPLDSRSVVP